MSFEIILKNLVDLVPQAIGAIIVDWEGEAVMEYCHCDPYNIRFIAAHQAIILSRIRELLITPESEDVEEVVIASSGGDLIIGCINPEYSLVMNIEHSSQLSTALYHFRRAITELKKEF